MTFKIEANICLRKCIKLQPNMLRNQCKIKALKTTLLICIKFSVFANNVYSCNIQVMSDCITKLFKNTVVCERYRLCQVKFLRVPYMYFNCTLYNQYVNQMFNRARAILHKWYSRKYKSSLPFISKKILTQAHSFSLR